MAWTFDPEQLTEDLLKPISKVEAIWGKGAYASPVWMEIIGEGD